MMLDTTGETKASPRAARRLKSRRLSAPGAAERRNSAETGSRKRELQPDDGLLLQPERGGVWSQSCSLIRIVTFAAGI